MQTIYRRWNCWEIISNNQYIATLGSGVTVLDRTTLEIIHHFTGIKYIHGGFFVSDDVLLVFTGEQQLIFLQISEKKLLWKCPRPKLLATSGDIRCCKIPKSKKIACIARGKQSLKEHFYLLVDYEHQTLSLHEIPNCYRVVRDLVWTHSFGLSFLSYEAKGNGMLRYSIIGLDEHGDSLPLFKWESPQIVKAYSGNYLFVGNNDNDGSQLDVYRVIKSPRSQLIEWENVFKLTLPLFYMNGPVGCNKAVLPSISNINENTGLLIAHSSNWIGVFDFSNNKLVAECDHNNISCGAIIDGNLFVGCSPGLLVCHLNTDTSKHKQ